MTLYVNGQKLNEDKFPAGTAALPPITFAADPNTGIYRPAADVLGLVTGGTERMRIDSSGNVGIGLTAWGTSAAKVLGIASGTAPTTSPADAAQVWVADRGGTAGKASLHVRTEDGTSHVLGDRVGLGTVTPRVAGVDVDTGTLAGTALQLPHVVNKVASANVRNSADAERSSSATTYTQFKVITLTNGLVGQARFLFDLKTTNAAQTAYGRIYRNGVALGTEQTDATGAYVTKSEDITQDWNPGDTCELWLHATAPENVYARNFRIAYDDSPTVAVASTSAEV